MLRWCAIASLAAAAAGVSAQAVQGVTDAEIVIGSITDLSGPVASVGAPHRDGMLLAAEEINAAGGIHGRKLRIVVEDSSYDPKKAVLAAQKLLTQDKVFALIGTLGSAAVQSTQNLALDRNVPNLFPMASSEISYLPYHPLKFGIFPPSSEHMRVVVKYAHDRLNKRRFAIIYQDDETGQAAMRAAEAQLKVHGLTPVEKTSHKRGDTSFSSQVSRMKAANPDIVLLGVNPREAAAIAAETRTQGWPVDIILYTGATAAVTALGGKAAEGMYGANGFVGMAQQASPAYQAISERFKARFGRDMADGVNFGYATVMLFAEGAKNAGRDLTPLSFSQGLEKVKDFRTVFEAAPVSYAPNDHAPPKDAYIFQVKSGKWTMIDGPMSY
ncbi:MAG TPA: ABC transporter substrate-binding protein, partial [Alphaproteobacteria bacterium]|nr:ABC transporter substrate-binding protein [Alphaproteobacteria bacterium]